MNPNMKQISHFQFVRTILRKKSRVEFELNCNVKILNKFCVWKNVWYIDVNK